MLSLVHKAASPGLGLLRPSHSGPDQAPASTSAGWNKSGTWKMLPYKKRRTTLRESAQHQGNQEEDDVDLQADGKPESDLGSVKDLGSVSLSWSPSRGRAADLEVQAAGIQLGMEDPSLSSRMLTEHTNVAVLEAVDVAVSQEITLASLESSQPVNTHIGKGKLQATSSRRGKKITLRPESVTQEDRGDHPIAKEPFSEERGEEVKEEGTYRLPYLLKQVAWILATSKVFMYPELLPVCL
nr:GON-4-like protein isoform X4 [Bubalus bubalis]